MDPHALPAGCPEPVSLVTAELLKNGLLGVAILVLVGVVIFLFKRSERQADRLTSALEAKEKENAAKIKELDEQIEALVQRHIGKAETWVDKGQELASKLNGFLETIAREVRERGRDNAGVENLVREQHRETREALLREVRDTIIRAIRNER